MTSGTIARWVAKQKKESDADKAAGRPNRVQRAAQRVIARENKKMTRHTIGKAGNEPHGGGDRVQAKPPTKHLYGGGGIKDPLHREPILKPHTKPTHQVMAEHGMKPPKPPPKRQDHPIMSHLPRKVHTETQHQVVATNARGASVFLKGATAKKN